MEDYKKEDNLTKITLSLIFVIILFISVICITYAVFSYSREGMVKNVINTGTITFSYAETSNGITLTNAMPISDSIGKNLEKSGDSNSYFDFNVSCKMTNTDRIQYEIYTTKDAETNEVDEKYVKIYLTDKITDKPLSGYDEEVPTYYNLKDSISKDNAKELYRGSFTSSGVQSFRLRMWLDENYNLQSSSQIFKVKVNVVATDR